MTDKYPDPWDEFEELEDTEDGAVRDDEQKRTDKVGEEHIGYVYPEGQPQGFGFRTGVRSAKVAFGFAVFILTIGTLLLLMGAAIFIGERQWLGLGLMVLIEIGFILAFSRLLVQARKRRSA